MDDGIGAVQTTGAARRALVAVERFVLATRDSGYKDTSSAVAELVDNAAQAGARRVLIRVDDDEKRMIQDAARRRGQTVSLTVIEAVKLLEGSLYVEEEEHDSPTVQALREIEYQLRRIGRNVNQIAHNANREMNATIEDEALRLSREQA